MKIPASYGTKWHVLVAEEAKVLGQILLWDMTCCLDIVRTFFRLMKFHLSHEQTEFPSTAFLPFPGLLPSTKAAFQARDGGVHVLLHRDLTQAEQFLSQSEMAWKNKAPGKMKTKPRPGGFAHLQTRGPAF